MDYQSRQMQALSEIHDSFVNGQIKQAVKQMDEYSMYDFFEDYSVYLEQICSNYNQMFDYLKQAASAYFRIKNR
jgi:hypothetical protein